MGKMLVVVDTEKKVAALQSQLEGECELFVLAVPPLKVTLKPCPPGQQCEKGKFSFSFQPLDAGKPLLGKLREYTGSEIYLAFDRDPRGEFMSWLVAKAMELVSPGAPPPRRLHLLALHAEELRESFRLVEPIHIDRAVGYHDRAVFDVALGKHINRLLGTRTGPAGVPLSTSCLTTLLLLAEREAEIKAHAARPKQRLRVKFAAGEAFFTAFLAYAFGVSDDGDLYGVKDVEAALQLLRSVTFEVAKISRAPLVLEPPAPYRLVDLLEDAFVVHGISLGKTMATVQRLFDGVSCGGGEMGLVTSYAAVDIPTAVTVENIRRQVVEQVGDEALLPDGSVAAGEGFLLPTRPDLEPEQLPGNFDADARCVYGLIRSRALASQMQPAAGEAVEVQVQAGEHCFFKAVGNDITQPGHLAVFQGLRGRNLLEQSPLRGLQVGDTLGVEQIVPEPAQSDLARFYTMESLFVDLDDFSIEPGPTSVAVLHQLVAGGYVEVLASGELRCRGNADKVTSTLNRAFPTMQGVNLIAYLEQTIGEVLSGRKALDVALRQFDQTMVMKGNVLQKVSVSAQMQARLRKRKPQGVIKGGAPARPPRPRAPVTKAPPVQPLPPQSSSSSDAAVEREGLLVAEEGVGVAGGVVDPLPEEHLPVTAEVVDADVAADAEAGGAEVESFSAVEAEPEPVPTVDDLSGGDGEAVVESPPVVEEGVAEVESALAGGVDEAAVLGPQPVTAEAAPEAAAVFEQAAEEAVIPAASREVEFPEADRGAQESSIECPVCHKGRVLHKKTPTGKPFYVCPREECEFMAWALPHPLPCQVCGSSFLVEKKDLRGHLFLRCPKAGCNYRQPLPGDDGAALLASEQEGVKKKKVLVRRVSKGAATGGKKRKVLVRRRK